VVKARQQLGTVGSGNHYVDLFADETGALWVGVHFGSRGFGHTVASAFLALGQGKAWGERVPETEVLLDLAQPVGHDYWHLMNLAGRYAYVTAATATASYAEDAEDAEESQQPQRMRRTAHPRQHGLSLDTPACQLAAHRTTELKVSQKPPRAKGRRRFESRRFVGA
jgi:hypothetical protein